MRKVKAILIDPFACTVTEVEHDADHPSWARPAAIAWQIPRQTSIARERS
jgi:hypothetical protein